MDTHVVVADIGSVRRSKFAWAAFDQSEGERPVATGHDPGTCVQAVVDALESGSPTALLFEAPMAVPVPSTEAGWKGLGRPRAGEGNRPSLPEPAPVCWSPDYLVTHNTDLAASYRSISIDQWTTVELARVVLAGADALGYIMPAATAKALAVAAQGSVWALQTSTARFYLDQIAGVPQYQNAGNDNVRVNLAAQRVSAERLPELATTLLRISDSGSTDDTGRSQVSYVVEAILRAAPQQSPVEPVPGRRGQGK